MRGEATTVWVKEGHPTVHLVEHERFFSARRGLYGEGGHDYGDNAERFAWFARAALAIPSACRLRPRVVHANDWQAGLCPWLLRHEHAQDPAHRPRVYFEEWNDPLISGIRWVSELIEAAGGEDCFAEESKRGAARERIIADPAEVVRRAPEIIIGSWCGRKFQPDHVRTRPGWDAVPAVRDDQLYEIKSADILSPGPAAITEGLAHLQRIVGQWSLSRDMQ